MEAVLNKTCAGGEWLVKESQPGATFIPEEFNEEQKMVRDMCDQFLHAEVLPNLDRIDRLEPGYMRALMQKAGKQGLFAASFPEAYGGLGKDFITSTIINEYLGAGHSFSVAVAAHTGIGTLPILYFGNDEQKQKYIPKLISGEWIGSYGLTEPGSGSDALSIKTNARLSEDGKFWVLNGQKCWITNGGFADIYTVFAKVIGDNFPENKKGFSAFIIERGAEGFLQGPEEQKMGIKGSSTVQLYFQDCKIPVENLLGEIGKGHKIAFNILNIGRLKLCAATLGGAKKAITISVEYALTREQFKQPIGNFGAIKHKLAQMTIETFADESALYRTAKWIDDKEQELLETGKPVHEALLGAAEEFAIECAILKVHGSETLDVVVDEGVQIHGGNGFSAEYNISRAYRDSRINRIFEGTNEINRLLIVDMTLKRAMQGRLNLMGAAMKVQQDLMSIPDFNEEEETLFAQEKKIVQNFKKTILLAAGAAAQKLMMQLEQEQEILLSIADMAIETFVAESLLLRVIKLSNSNEKNIYHDILNCYLYDAADRIHKYGKDAINAFAEGDEQRMMLMGLKRFTKVPPYNSKDARRRIANELLQQKKYPF
ncbi:MAG: acyl-CoA dehydrogenase family protein [Chitinophagaceae bacterium]